MIDKPVECLKQNTGIENLRVIKSKRQVPNLKKNSHSLKNKLEFINVLTKDVNVAQAYS